VGLGEARLSWLKRAMRFSASMVALRPADSALPYKIHINPNRQSVGWRAHTSLFPYHSCSEISLQDHRGSLAAVS